MSSNNVPGLYRSVIDDVINSVRNVFLDEQIDEQILTELKQTWERKLIESKGMDPPAIRVNIFLYYCLTKNKLSI